LLDEFEKLVNEFEASLDEEINKIRLRVMILGPNTDGTTTEAELRKFIIEKCEEQAITIKGEHKKLIEVYKKKIGTGGNLCGFELILAQKGVDAVIIIPASPGSLVELGMFANIEDICRRTLVLFSENYKDDSEPSFIHLGPKLAYKNQGATVEFVNYIEKEKVWKIVNQFVQIYKANKLHKTILKS
jgi:hypothetical protein